MKDLRGSKHNRDDVTAEMKKELEEKLKGAGVNAKLTPEQLKQAQEIKRKLGRLKNKDENQLMDQIFNIVRQQKAEGKLDDRAIERMAAAAAPMLNEEQRKKMAALLEQMKKV